MKIEKIFCAAFLATALACGGHVFAFNINQDVSSAIAKPEQLASLQIGMDAASVESTVKKAGEWRLIARDNQMLTYQRGAEMLSGKDGEDLIVSFKDNKVWMVGVNYTFGNVRDGRNAFQRMKAQFTQKFGNPIVNDKGRRGISCVWNRKAPEVSHLLIYMEMPLPMGNSVIVSPTLTFTMSDSNVKE